MSVTNRIFETDIIPRNVNPLSISVQPPGKKLLMELEWDGHFPVHVLWFIPMRTM